MLFYKAEGRITESAQVFEGGYKNAEEGAFFTELTDTFFQEHGKRIFIFVSSAMHSRIKIGAIIEGEYDAHKSILEYLEAAEIKADIAIKETTFSTLVCMLNSADRMNYVTDADETLDMFGIERSNRMRRDFEEILLQPANSEEAIMQTASAGFCAAPLKKELERIFSGKSYDKFIGHPVHYIVEADSEYVCQETCTALISALYEKRRIISARYSIMTLDIRRNTYQRDDMETIYRLNCGGAVVVNIPFEGKSESMFSSGAETLSEVVKLCFVAKNYSGSVLTIFVLSSDCKNAKQKIYECLENISFVEITQKSVFGESAKMYLEMLAKKRNLTPDSELSGLIEDGLSYILKEMNELFLGWADKKMKKDIFPQYGFTERAAAKIQREAPKGSAYEELQNMIGLKNVKEIIDKALKYYKAQKLFETRGLKAEKTAMNMVFTGNPGTAKTSVARLFARIMKDNGILSVGNLVEVGRADLVGRYVGWTAKTVKEKFKEARGSVLFIDEAYSLLDGDHNTYGVEAINTIVAEMENNRDDMIVIFAGYPDEMREFIDKNPGMSSRIAFHIAFDDYSAEELFDITALMAKKQDRYFSEDVREKLISLYESARTDKTFGNGRYARNIFEKALMNQGARLIDSDLDALTNSDMRVIKAEDIEIPKSETPKERAVGFVI